MVITAQNTNQKPGYKQTEVGMIPEDWEVKTFGEVLTGFTSGATPSRKHPDFYKGNIRWITSGELNYNVIMDTIEKISIEAASKTNLKLLPKGTFLIAITGMEAEGTRGSCGIVGTESTTNQHCMALVPKKHLSTCYLFHYYVYKGKSLALQYCQGTKQQDFTAKIVKLLPISLPPLAEQTAIATTLSNVDALITSLDKLIAKKRDIKQATMQQLLTGKMRLPGFRGEWEVKKIGEILRVCHGKSQRGVVVDDGKYPILATGGEIGRTNDYLYDKPSVLIGRKGTIDSPQYIDIPFWTIDTLFYTEISECVHPRFVFYLFNMINWLRYNEASGVPSLNASTIEKIEVRCSPLPEQTVIASVLSDMDAEIAALEQRRDKTRALKQGMMQELLTGKTRLL